jgi:hypothetical protein
MKPILCHLAAATVLRLLISLVAIPNTANDSNGMLSGGTLGPGILPAISAAILDPVHTWDHLEEACFWLENSPSMWTESWIRGGGSDAGYKAIYTPGTRIIASPLVVALLGETLVCPHSKFLRGIQTLILLLADAIGAYCMYHLGKRIIEIEGMENEADMERVTILSDKNTVGEGKLNDDLVIPGILRPERGWIVDLPSKILPPEEYLIKTSAIGTTSDDKKKPECDRKDDGSSKISFCTPSTSMDREPLLSLNQLPIVASLLYISNPISMLANASGSLRSIWDSCMLVSFYYATIPPTKTSKEGVPIKIPSATMVAVALCMATYADVGYATFLLPILLWRGLFSCGKAKGTTIERAQHRDWKQVLALFIVYLSGLHYFASLLVGGGSTAYRQVLARTVLPNIAFVQQDFSGSVPGPSMGLHWCVMGKLLHSYLSCELLFCGSIFFLPLQVHVRPNVR